MGLFDKFKKKTESENKETEEIEALGWDAITAEFERIYPDQKKPKHYGTLIGWALGGNDPLDGISIYDGGDYWHFVSYGMTELYEKEEENEEIIGLIQQSAL
ncbi:MAG: suppressor of fused domain protein [Roseburia sp.]|nr:suppressor of fused domain protein [Roseburia sp.]